MKLSVVFFVVLVASACANDAAKAQKARIGKIEQKCLKEADTTLEEFLKCREENKKCPKADCFVSCYMRENHFINKDGTINTKMMEQYEAFTKNGHPKMAKAIKKCFVDPSQKLNFCDVGPALHRCMDKEPQD